VGVGHRLRHRDGGADGDFDGGAVSQAQYEQQGAAEQWHHENGCDFVPSNESNFWRKTMAFIATKPQSNYTPPPAGMHPARCYRLIDLGTQPKSYQGKPTGEARKVMASWELLGEDRMDDGKPFTISKSWFMSLHEKAALRKDLESWRGRPFTVEEEASFDVSKLLGAYCLLNVVQEAGQDGPVYTKISAITPMLKGMPKPEPVNATAIFDADNPDMEMFEKFSDKMKETIRGCREWRARAAGGRVATTAVNPGTKGSGFDDMDDDIPF